MRALAGHEYCGEHVLRSDLKNEYFVRNINSGLPKPEGSQSSTKDVSDEELLATIEKLERISEALADRPETYGGLHEGLSAELDELSDCAVAQKHLKQKAALLGLAESRGLLGGQACYVEFGAGRGGGHGLL
ncbi:hypothetical protein HPB47_021216 [Ixodes persulcatus]|uniref:Uncharacterized protein n=1 Tax=Ixodes persulcatus TaxID=34615 RepID=A0AC60QD65_IXOPE|nr:hypothetical protein HPB47_021216 [Ixodes persulcatus]